LREHTRALAQTLLSKNRAAVRAAKHAFRRVGAMSWDDSDDYLAAKLDQLRLTDPEGGRNEGMRQFLDDKTYRPGLGGYQRGKGGSSGR
jgi:trans-feruloyl-CoA hydratase/vanillin synthase